MTQILIFLVFLSVSVLVYWFVLPKTWRSAFLFAASLFFISLFGIKYTLFYLVNAGMVYGAGRLIQGSSARHRKLLLQLALFWLVGSLCAFKYGHLIINPILKLGFQAAAIPEITFSGIAMPLGMSYISFRLIHYIVEIYRKTLPAHTFVDLGLYVFFFPTFLSGPVDRFQKVQPQTSEKKPFDPSDINYGLYRTVVGMVKKFIVADSLLPVLMPVLSSPHDHSWILVMLAVYGLTFQLYMDFSGYTDMAIGVSRLFGYKIMENFNRPFMQKNIAMFWRNWHMSVYSFIRDYFFFPIFGHRASAFKIYMGMVLTMVVFCLWHVGSLQFLILGIYHGMALVVWQYIQEIKRKRRGVRKFFDNPLLDPFFILLTASFVTLGNVVFYFDLNVIQSIFQKIFLPQ